MNNQGLNRLFRIMILSSEVLNIIFKIEPFLHRIPLDQAQIMIYTVYCLHIRSGKYTKTFWGELYKVKDLAINFIIYII